ncbi:restriction endonuclease subunit S [Corynebacterium callunae]|uniref:restriction endonuclease subunit S n=1 Tax=Corynebacterium callunae TaxID=1721 RepID=UPI003982C584
MNSSQLPRELGWVEKLPQRYRVARLGSVANPVKQRNIGNRNTDLLSLSYGNIISKDIESVDGLLPESFETYNTVEPGDVVFRLTDLQNDKRSLRTGLVKQSGIITSAYVSVRPVAIEARYLAYFMRAMDLAKVFYSLGGGLRQSLNYAEAKLLPVVLPPEGEQRAIADYLDRETAEIDAFIADLDDYSTLLSHRLDAERDRTFLALLDSSNPVPLKRWLKIPLSYGATAAANHFDPGEVRYLRITDFGAEGDLRPEVATSLPYEAAAGYMTAPGDILLARSGATVGKAFMVPDSLPEACFAGYLVRARCQNRVEASFVWHALQTTKYKDWIAANATVATIQNVSAQKFGTYRIPRPSLAKQSEVIEELDRVQKNIDASQALSAEARTLAVERRAALISAAVTGQIDVTAQGMSAAEQLRDELEVHV